MSASDDIKSQASEFDENAKTGSMDKYSRQVGAYGVGVMKFLRTTNVLIVGLKGVGVETAKDLVLTGPKGVHVYDSGNVEIADLGTNFFFRKEHIGQPRTVCVSSLQELNDDVDVQGVKELNEETIKKYQSMIVTDSTIPFKQLVEWNKICRSNKIPFFLALTTGLTGVLFSDFGDKHVCQDDNGEPHKFVAIQNISVEKSDDGKNFIRVKLDENHELDSGESIQFEDVEGIPELTRGKDDFGNQLPSKPFEIKRVYHKYKDDKTGKDRQRLIPDQLDIVTGDDDDVSKWGVYQRGGFIREVKKVHEWSYKSLADAHESGVHHPHTMRFLMNNAANAILLGQYALWDFIEENGSLPKLHDQDDAKKFLLCAKKVNETQKRVDQINEDDLSKISLYARAETSGYSAFLGGAIAQEIIKASGKWKPINQWVVIDSLGLLSKDVPQDAKPQGTRYDHQISLFGKAFQDQIMNERWFLVGCGALGCEYMKAFALMGVGSGDKGQLVCTDMDTIEVSNLARQFLFRRKHVSKPKSTCAAETARLMNPDMDIKVYGIKVAPSTENVFSASFWQGLNGICNALDNVKARLYVDSQCVLWQRPLLESGTLGTKANNEVIVPKLTQSYGEGHVEVKEKHVPQCTMKNFPYMIEHTIGWAGRAGEFSTLFVTPANDLSNLVKGAEEFWKGINRIENVEERAERVDKVKELLKYAENRSFDGCVQLAFNHFIKQYRDRILDLIHYFPEDAKKTVDDKEVPFWSAPKRFPTAAKWDPKNPADDHLDYVYNTSNLYAHMFNIPHIRDRKQFREKIISLNLTPEEWKPSDKKPEIDEDKKDDKKDDSSTSSSSSSSSSSTTAAADDDDVDELELAKESLAESKQFFEKYDFSALRKLQKEFNEKQDNLIRPADFEKDDDTNFHIDFVTSASNLRATNYSIPVASRHKTKMTAGRIIPAIATTTAMITGLNSIEFYKILKGVDVEQYCNSNVNLGTSGFSQFEPTPPGKAEKEYSDIEMCDVVPVPDAFTCWDSIKITDKPGLTVQELIDQFPSIHHGCTPTQISGTNNDEKSKKTQFLYMDFAPTPALKKRNDEYLKMKVIDAYKENYGDVESPYIKLSILCEKDDEPVKIPNPVVYYY